MKKIFAIAAATGLMLSISGASAQDEMKGMYVTGEGASRMVMGGEMTAGAPVLAGTNGAAPADCPEGSFYEGTDSMIVACGADGAQFNMMAPPAGTMMPNGEAYPEGAMMMEMRAAN